MEAITISRFKATCLEVLRKVQITGQPVLITRRGEPVAEIRPPSPRHRGKSWLGCARDSVRIHGDIISPLPEDDWEVLQSNE